MKKYLILLFLFPSISMAGDGYTKNHLSLSGGIAPIGIDKNNVTPGHIILTQNYLPTFGIGYSRSLDRNINVGVQVFTNNSYFATFGVDF